MRENRLHSTDPYRFEAWAKQTANILTVSKWQMHCRLTKETTLTEETNRCARHIPRQEDEFS